MEPGAPQFPFLSLVCGLPADREGLFFFLSLHLIFARNSASQPVLTFISAVFTLRFAPTPIQNWSPAKLRAPPTQILNRTQILNFFFGLHLSDFSGLAPLPIQNPGYAYVKVPLNIIYVVKNLNKCLFYSKSVSF